MAWTVIGRTQAISVGTTFCRPDNTGASNLSALCRRPISPQTPQLSAVYRVGCEQLALAWQSFSNDSRGLMRFYVGVTPLIRCSASLPFRRIYINKCSDTWLRAYKCPFGTFIEWRRDTSGSVLPHVASQLEIGATNVDNCT
jgi:hypothetical protein